jgi:hypothetical protein
MGRIGQGAHSDDTVRTSGKRRRDRLVVALRPRLDGFIA